MHLRSAAEPDYPDVVALANLAYRGDGTSTPPSWNIEAGIVSGQRLDNALLRQQIAAKPAAHLLLYRDDPLGPLLGTVWLEPQQNGTWYLGLLTIHPGLQNRQLGRTLLAAAEHYAKDRGASRIRMTVLHVRDLLIAWYQRRGYALTGETEPFPYGDERFGKPLRDNLAFVILEKDI